MPKLINGSNPRLKCFITACIFITLGIPLIIYSTRTPLVEDLSQLLNNPTTSNGSEDLLNKLLSYPSDAVLTIKVDLFQRLTCGAEMMMASKYKSPMPVNPKCSKIMKDWTKLLKKNQCGIGGGEKLCCPDGTPANKDLSDCDHTADEINTLRMSSLVIGILLLCFAALKLIEIAMIKK